MRQLEKLMVIWQIIIKQEKVGLNDIEQLEEMLRTEQEQVQTMRSPQVQKRYTLLMDKIKEDTQRLREKAVGEHEDIGRDNYKKRVDDFLQNLQQAQGEECVFIFSGTADIQRIKGNRPIRLALTFEKKGVPVIYSYWRWHKTDLIPDYKSNLLMQIPIDETMKYMLDIIRAPLPQKHKVFIFEFPYPPATKYLELFKYYGWKVIYDIRDDWEEFEKVGQAKWYEKWHEIYTIETADCTVAVSAPLTTKFIGDTDKKIKLLPNALDEGFSLKGDRERRQKIGYVGHLTPSWFDWDALRTIAAALPHDTIEVIGHSKPDYLQALPPNIIYLGPKTFEEVKQYAKTWRVGIIPFKINALTKAVDPIKVYEYLSMGLKVVSFDMPQIKNYPEIKLAHTTAEFIQSIKEAMVETFDEQKVEAFLKENTWGKRVDWLREWSKS
ncbi:MAG: hypothetical protein ACRDDX_06910 [Cellulosilyticaceae bacterium]